MDCGYANLLLISEEVGDRLWLEQCLREVHSLPIGMRLSVSFIADDVGLDRSADLVLWRGTGDLSSVLAHWQSRPVVVLVNPTNEADGLAALELGAADYLIPAGTTGRTLVHLIRHLVGHKANSRKRQSLQNFLHQLSLSLLQLSEPESVYELVLDGLERELQVGQTVIARLENGATGLSLITARPEIEIPIEQPIPIPDSLVWQTILDQKRGCFAVDDFWLSGMIPGRNLNHHRITPIVIQNQLLGILYCGRQEPFSEIESQTIQPIADLLASKIEKFNLLAEVQRQVKELQILQDVALTGSLAVQEETLLQKATEIIGQLLTPINYGVLLLNEATNTLQTHPTYRIDSPLTHQVAIPLGEGITGIVAATGRVWRVDDVHQVTEYLGLDPLTKSELCAPLVAGQRILGVLNVESERRNGFSAKDAQFLTTLGSQVATALEKIRLLEAERRGRREAEILREAAKAVASTLDLGGVLSQILLALEQVIRFDSAEIFLLDKMGWQLVASKGWPTNQKLIGQRYPANDELFTQLQNSLQPICLPDVQGTPLFHFWGHSHYIRAWMGVPLVIDEQMLGVMTINSQHVNRYGPAEVVLAQAFTHHAAMAVKNARLFESVQRYIGDLELASKVLHCLNASPDVLETFSAVAGYLRTVSNCFRISLTLLDEQQEQFYFQGLDQPAPANSRRISWPISASTAASDILAGRIHLTPDLSLEQEGSIEKLLYQSGQRSRINLPLVVNERILGSLNLTWLIPAGFNLEQLPLLMQIADAMALAVDRSRLLAQIQGNLIETRSLYQISQALIAIENSDHLLQSVVENVAEILPAGLVFFLVFSDQPLAIAKMAMAGPEQMLAQEMILEQLADNPILHLTKPTLWVKESGESWPGLTYGSLMAVPLSYRQKKMGLLLAVNRPEGADFTIRNLDLLTNIAHQVAIVLDNVQLLEETQQHKQELEILVTFSADLRSKITLTDLLSLIVEKSVALVQADQGCILLLDEQKQTLVRRAITPDYHGILGEHLPLSRGISGYVMETGQPYLADELQGDPVAHVPTSWSRIKSSITLPLRTHENQVGVINIGSVHNRFTNEQCRLLMAIAEIAGNAIQRAIVMETLEQRVQERTSALAQANEQLKALDRLKTQFISDVSHELRTPIANLSLYLDLLERGRPEKQEQYWATIRKQSDRLTQLIEDVLNLSRLELRSVKTNFVFVDFKQIVEQVIATLGSAPRMAALSLSVQPAGTIPPLWGDRNQLSQMITRLLTNSMNFTPAGGFITISTLVEAKGNHLYLEIKDSGVGISPEDMPHIFERFYRGQAATYFNIPGSGLGLTIVKEIVHLHGGLIEVQSQAGVGTTFQIWLPIEPGGPIS